VEDFWNGKIKKHESTLTYKKEKLAHFLEKVSLQAEPVLLTYQANSKIELLMNHEEKNVPIINHIDETGVRHKVWRIDNRLKLQQFKEVIDQIDSFYVADGHHRIASAALYAQKHKEKNKRHNGNEPYNFVFSFIVSSQSIKINDYNRVVKDLNQAVRYILEKKYELGLFQDPYRFYDENRSKRIINSLKIRETSRKMAERSIVLLKNDNHILPFNNEVRSIALIGHLAKSQSDMAGAWAGNVNRSKIVTLYEALRNNNINIFYSEGYDKKTGKITQLQTSLQAAQKADAVIVCIGELAEQSGESKSLRTI
jgi:hypothetical protein